MTKSKSKIHPYQDQVNRMWELIKRRKAAKKQGCLIEHISLSYTLLEVELRLLLTSQAGGAGIPLPRRRIDSQRYLIKLADIARNNGFIDQDIFDRILKFNDKRRRAIHRLAQGEITYKDLEDPDLEIEKLIFDIQSRWLHVKIGPVKKAPKVSE